MKGFIKLIIYVISIMMTMMTFVSSLVLGFRVIQLLWQGGINPTLCLECFGSFVLFGIFAACVKTFSPENITYSTGIKESLETLSHDSHRETVGDIINSKDE